MKKMMFSYSVNKKLMQGATLIEVMVSVFILTFGVLALMAAQLRSVASVSEAESKSVVAQAAEALADGMRANPTRFDEVQLGSSANPNQKAINSKLKWRYDDYLSTSWTVANDRSAIDTTISGSKLGKKRLAELQLNDFKRILTQNLPNASQVSYAICLDDSKNPKEPTLSSPNCANTGFDSVTVIKVLWCMNGATGTDGGSNSCGDPGNSTTYTYTLKVSD